MLQELLTKMVHHMDRTVEELEGKFSTVRAGKASPAVLDPIRVDYYGSMVPLSQVANMSAPEARMILIQPWEKNMVGPIEKAILASDLGLNPSNDGVVVRVPLPELSEERRKDLVKQVSRMAEEAKVAVRNVRRDTNDHLKKGVKAGDFSEDEEKRALKEVQDATDKHCEAIDKLLDDKQKDIMQV